MPHGGNFVFLGNVKVCSWKIEDEVVYAIVEKEPTEEGREWENINLDMFCNLPRSVYPS